jgi:hypothetical protein
LSVADSAQTRPKVQRRASGALPAGRLASTRATQVWPGSPGVATMPMLRVGFAVGGSAAQREAPTRIAASFQAATSSSARSARFTVASSASARFASAAAGAASPRRACR